MDKLDLDGIEQHCRARVYLSGLAGAAPPYHLHEELARIQLRRRVWRVWTTGLSLIVLLAVVHSVVR